MNTRHDQQRNRRSALRRGVLAVSLCLFVSSPVLRNIHLVRPDLIPFPVAVEVLA